MTIRLRLAAVTAGLLITMTAGPLAAQQAPPKDAAKTAKTEQDSQPATRPIDMVIVLDTSGSMTDLIDSARGRIWSIVLKLAEAEPKPELRIGLLTYGTPTNSLEEDGWIVKQIDLTNELDDAYTKMMAMATEGGDEFVGWALHKALRNMDWSKDPSALRMIYIAGNESADQAAEVHNFREVAKEAAGRDVIINALYGGDQSTGVAEVWNQVPSGNGGEYFAINMAAGTVQIATPFDVELERLNLELNATLLPFGKDGEKKFNDVLANDAGATQMGWYTCTTRIAGKACGLWNNASWDLIDACAVAEFKLEDVADEELPEAMRNMTLGERKTYIAALKAAREAINAKIMALNEKREAYVLAIRARMNTGEQQSLDEAIMSTLVRQAKSKGFAIEYAQPVSVSADDEEYPAQEEIIFDLQIDRLMLHMPMILFESGEFRTFERDVAEGFAKEMEWELQYRVGDDTFSRFDDAQQALQAEIFRHAGTLMQARREEQKLEDGSTLVSFSVAGQTFASESAAEEVARLVQEAMSDVPAATSLDEVRQQARTLFAAGIRAKEQVTATN